MSEKVKLEEGLLQSIRESVAAKDEIRNQIFELGNSERIIKQQIENLWAKFYEVSAEAGPIFEELEKEHGVNSQIDLVEGMITPSGNFPE